MGSKRSKGSKRSNNESKPSPDGASTSGSTPIVNSVPNPRRSTVRSPNPPPITVRSVPPLLPPPIFYINPELRPIPLHIHSLLSLLSSPLPPPPSPASHPPPLPSPMGANSRDKSRGSRKHRPKPQPPPPAASSSSAAAAVAAAVVSSSDPSPNPNPSLGSHGDDSSGWGYCTEEQLEELLLKNLEFVYREALSRLVSLGYDESISMKAILRNGHCYGSMDALSNILHNAVAFLNSNSQQEGEGSSTASETAGFSDLRHLEEYSLAGMVCLLQQARPQLTRGDAMWCLLMADLHVGRASTIDVPSPEHALCKLHEQCDGRFDLNPLARSVLKRQPAVFGPRSDHQQPGGEERKDPEEVVAEVMQNLNLTTLEEGQPEEDDPKMAMILSLCRQIKDLKVQVQERRDWAQQKALQAARKVNNDLMELRLLRAEREENQKVKKGKQVLEDTTMKRLADMEASLRKASGQVDKANAEVRRLETENAEIRAEMEAAKLSAAESSSACAEAAKREKKCLKRLQTWDKQRERIQDEIAEERRKIAEVEQQLRAVKEGQKQAEAKWRKEIKAKERALAQVDEETRAKEAAEAEVKRRHEALRQKIELDFQRHKDDVKRLEEEYTRLKALAIAGSSQLSTRPLNSLTSAGGGDTVANKAMVSGSKKQKESSRKVNRNRICVVCLKDEVSVVLLPCAHQVLCPSCSEEQEKRSKSRCPICHVQVEERVRVFGASSS